MGNVCLPVCLSVCSEGGQPEDEDTPHRRKARKKAFSKIKKWGRRRGGGEEPSTLSYEATLSAGDKFAVKVNVFTL